MTKPTIILIPGSYNPPSAYGSIVTALNTAGYPTTGISLPTVGSAPKEGLASPAPSMYDDATAIAALAEQLADEGKDVVLVGHSYAGVPMSQSTKGLDKAARRAEGKGGGVVHLGFLSALVPELGGSAASLLGRFPDEKRPKVSVDVSFALLACESMGQC
jgi:pimeloyl-ACP methyl ester carboxylesterase